MANIRKWLEDAERDFGEGIEAMVVGPMNGWLQGEAKPKENVVLSRDDGLQMVDQEYDNGYGGPDCRSLYAWTRSRIFLIDEYDGSTNISYVPRNPVDCQPSFGGNGYY